MTPKEIFKTTYEYLLELQDYMERESAAVSYGPKSPASIINYLKSIEVDYAALRDLRGKL